MSEQPLWRPSPERIAAANLTAFRHFVADCYEVSVNDYTSLWRWSVEAREDFWAAVWDFCEVRATRPWDKVLTHGDQMPGARWFTGAQLNFAANLLRERSDRPAIIARTETSREQLTFAQLYQEVARLRAWMDQIGIQVGDRVAAFMPNIPATVVAALAAASLGAIFSSCSPDFGTTGAVERFGQIAPRLLVAADGYVYKGQAFDAMPRVREIAQQLPSVQHTLIAHHLHEFASLDYLPDPTLLSDLPRTDRDIPFVSLPFDHPLYILYSSGTTGRPKCIMHGAGGTLLQHLKEQQLHTDVKPDDRLFYFTTCGWMMWNWLISGLASGATIVLYDGAPMEPNPAAMFDLIDAEQISIFGTSAKYLAALEKGGVRPITTHQLSSLKTILSTGSPLPPEGFHYVYRDIKANVCLSSISGGTDIVSCFALGNPTEPVWPGEIQCRGLGMRVEVFDENGQSVRGQKGELVCTVPFPSMPVGFANDLDGHKYHDAYFARYHNVWHHGDYAELTPHDGMIIYGRSDAVLNPGGVRIGTAEIYQLVEQLPEVIESLAVGQEWQGDIRIILFVRLRDGVTLTEALTSQIQQHIRQGATPRHVPAKIIAVPEVPRTKSGKMVELAVREVIHGRPVHNAHALANPESLAYFRNVAELQS